MEKKNDLLTELRKSIELTQTGYAGLDRSGNKVDRRENPLAVPFARNSSLNIPSPKCIKCGNEVLITQLIESLCPECHSNLQPQ